MGGVGDKAPSGGLRGLEPIRQAVELRGNLRQLVPAPDRRAAAVGPLPNAADRLHQLADLPGQGPGQHHRQRQHQQRHHDGHIPQIGLKAPQKRRLLRVIFIGVDRADNLILIEHRRRRPAAEGVVFIGAVKNIVAAERLDNFGIEGIGAHGASGLPGIVEDASALVRDQDPGDSRLLHHSHGLGHILLRQPVQAGQRGHHHRHTALQGVLLGVERQVLGDQERIGIHQHQHKGDDDHIAQAEFILQTSL